jgi:uncharacterized membrane protein
MNIVLWIIQALLALFFLVSGIIKLSTRKEKLEESQPWAKDFVQGQVRGIGILEVLGALGLVVPQALDIMPGLTVLAAAWLAIMMIAAAWVHLRRGEMRNIVLNVVLVVLAAFVAFARYAGF